MGYIEKQFKRKDGKIVTFGLSNVPDSLNFEFAGDPININYAGALDNIYKPVIYTSADINIVTDRFNWDLYVKYAQESRVRISAEDFEFRGYLSGDVLDQNTQWTKNQITLSAVDCLSSLEYFIWSKRGSDTVKNILQEIFAKAGISSFLGSTVNVEKNWTLVGKGTTDGPQLTPTQEQLKNLYNQLQSQGYETWTEETDEHGPTGIVRDPSTDKNLVYKYWWSKPYTDTYASYMWFGDNNYYNKYFGGGSNTGVTPEYKHPIEILSVVQDVWCDGKTTYKEVLESIMTFLNLTCVQMGSRVYIFDYQNVGEENEFYSFSLEHNLSKVDVISFRANIEPEDIRSAGTISISEVTRKASVTGNFDMTNLIPAATKSDFGDRTTWGNWERGTYNGWTGYIMIASNTNWQFIHGTGTTVFNTVTSKEGGYYLTIGDEDGKNRQVKTVLSTAGKTKYSTVEEYTGNYGGRTTATSVPVWSGNPKKIYHITTGYKAVEIQSENNEIYSNPIRVNGNITYGNDLSLKGEGSEIMIPCTVEFGNWILVSYKADNVGEPWASSYIYYEGGVEKYKEDFGRYPVFFLMYDSTGNLKNNLPDNLIVYDDGYYIIPPKVTEESSTEMHLQGCVEGRFKMTIFLPESKYNYSFFGFDGLSFTPTRLGIDKGLDYEVNYSNVPENEVIGKELNLDFQFLTADKDATVRNMPFYPYQYYNNIDKLTGVTMSVFMDRILLSDRTTTLRPEEYAIQRIVDQYSSPCKIIKVALHKPIIRPYTMVTMPQGDFLVAGLRCNIKDGNYDVELIEKKSKGN